MVSSPIYYIWPELSSFATLRQGDGKIITIVSFNVFQLFVFVHIHMLKINVRLFISAFMYISMSLIFYSRLRQSLNCSSNVASHFLNYNNSCFFQIFGLLGRMNRPNHRMNNDVLYRMGGDSHRIRQERPWIVAKAVRLSSWIFSLFENKRNETMQVVSLARHAGATTSCYHATRARSTSIE